MPSKSKSDTETMVFESAITKLEAITNRLESEDTSLADSLASFEEGVTLTRDAQRALATAEQKVRLLLEENGEPIASQTSDFEDLE
ncbi:MAG: exodeoxyribonuclease VII small subunit [Halieaceae bacterium]